MLCMFGVFSGPDNTLFTHFRDNVWKNINTEQDFKKLQISNRGLKVKKRYCCTAFETNSLISRQNQFSPTFQLSLNSQASLSALAFFHYIQKWPKFSFFFKSQVSTQALLPITDLYPIFPLYQNCSKDSFCPEFVPTLKHPPTFQFTYRPGFSIETALSRIFNNLSNICGNGNCSIMVGLDLSDLSAAFDTSNHRIELEKLKSDFGIGGLAFSWIQSYLCETWRPLSAPVELLAGVP